MKWAIVALVAVAVLDLAGFVSFLVSTWVDNIAARFAFSGDSASDIRSADLAQLFSDVFDLIAAVLAIVVIRAVTARQSERAVAVSSG